MRNEVWYHMDIFHLQVNCHTVHYHWALQQVDRLLESNEWLILSSAFEDDTGPHFWYRIAICLDYLCCKLEWHESKFLFLNKWQS